MISAIPGSVEGETRRNISRTKRSVTVLVKGAFPTLFCSTLLLFFLSFPFCSSFLLQYCFCLNFLTLPLLHVLTLLLFPPFFSFSHFPHHFSSLFFINVISRSFSYDAIIYSFFVFSSSSQSTFFLHFSHFGNFFIFECFFFYIPLILFLLIHPLFFLFGRLIFLPVFLFFFFSAPTRSFFLLLSYFFAVFNLFHLFIFICCSFPLILLYFSFLFIVFFFLLLLLVIVVYFFLFYLFLLYFLFPASLFFNDF